jgi:hypothetical protein
MLGLTRRLSFCLLDRQLQVGYLLYQDIYFGFEIVYFEISTLQSFLFLFHHTL